MKRTNEKTEDADSAPVARPGSAVPPLGRPLQASVFALRYLWERALHRARHAKAQRRIAAAPPIRSVLFICQGNICRSPFAVAVFARSMRARGYIRVAASSAGFVNPRRQSPAPALAAASRRNIDLSSHRSTLVTPAALNAADLVVVMAAEQATMLRRRFGRIRGSVLVLGDLDPNTIRGRTIVDPWGREDAVYDASYDRIVRCVQGLTRILAPFEPHSR